MPNSFDTDAEGPSLGDLAAIEAEWPQIQADIDALADPGVIDALVDAIDAVERSGPNATDHRRQRRLTSRITRSAVGLTAAPSSRKAAA
jgi:hypothetical protein